MPFAVSLERIRSALGGGDKNLARDVCATLGSLGLRNGASAAGVYELLGVVGARKATAPADPGYAFEGLCAHLGDMLSNERWSSMRMAWFEGVDQALKELGGGVSLWSYFCKAPLGIHAKGDFPTIGHVAQAEMPALREKLGAALSAAAAAGTHDAEASAIAEFVSWLETAERRGVDLVFFYH
jgi:hypothetical protein